MTTVQETLKGVENIDEKCEKTINNIVFKGCENFNLVYVVIGYLSVVGNNRFGFRNLLIVQRLNSIIDLTYLISVWEFPEVGLIS